MGFENSGRRPTPAPLRPVKGLGPRTVRTRYNLTASYPAPPPSFDAPPEELTGNVDALKEWARLLPILRESGNLSSAERPAIIAACVEWARYLDVVAHVATDGPVATGSKVNLVKSAYAVVAADSLKLCHLLWKELGLTPKSRTRIQPALKPEPMPKWG